jgi:hypothetical protein
MALAVHELLRDMNEEEAADDLSEVATASNEDGLGDSNL